MEEQFQSEMNLLKKVPFQIDEGKLTQGQRRALKIAKAQGAPFNRRLEDLIQNVDEKDVTQFKEAIMSARHEGRKSFPHNPLED